MSEENLTKRMLSSVRNLVKRESDEPEAKVDDGAQTEVEPGDAPTVLDSPGAVTGSAVQHQPTHSTAHVVIEHSKLLPWLFLCAILSGAAIMGALWAISEANAVRRESDLRQQASDARYADLAERFRVAEREARVATERYNDIAVQLAKRQIPVSEH